MKKYFSIIFFLVFLVSCMAQVNMNNQAIVRPSRNNYITVIQNGQAKRVSEGELRDSMSLPLIATGSTLSSIPSVLKIGGKFTLINSTDTTEIIKITATTFKADIVRGYLGATPPLQIVSGLNIVKYDNSIWKNPNISTGSTVDFTLQNGIWQPLKGVLTLADFGLKSTNTASQNNTALQNALTYAKSGGNNRAVILPIGVYYFSLNIVFDGNAISFKGFGASSELVFSGTGTAFKISSTNTRYYNINLSDFQLSNTSYPSFLAGSTGIDYGGASVSTFSNINILGFENGMSSINGTATYYNEFKHITINGNGSPKIGLSNGNLSNENLYLGVSLKEYAVGVKDSSTTNNTFINCSFETFDTAAIIKGSYSTKFIGSRLEANKLTNTVGFYSDNVSDGTHILSGYFSNETLFKKFDLDKTAIVETRWLNKSYDYTSKDGQTLRYQTDGSSIADSLKLRDLKNVLTNYGYSASYKVYQLTNDYPISLNYNPKLNTSSNFTGDRKDVLLDYNTTLYTPTAADNNFYKVLKFLDAGQMQHMSLQQGAATDSIYTLTGGIGKRNTLNNIMGRVSNTTTVTTTILAGAVYNVDITLTGLTTATGAFTYNTIANLDDNIVIKELTIPSANTARIRLKNVSAGSVTLTSVVFNAISLRL